MNINELAKLYYQTEINELAEIYYIIYIYHNLLSEINKLAKLIILILNWFSY